MRTFIVFCVVVLALLTGNTNVSAQAIGQQPPSLTVSPAYPAPYETVTAALDAYTIDTTGASISWFVDGISVPNAQNERSVSFEVGGSGVPTTARAQIVLPNGQQVTVSKTITPIRVDIIIEADTYTPLHYKGRALPSSGSSIRAVALPETNTPATQLSYKWSINNKVLFGGPVLGKNIAVFEAPDGGTALVSVDVSDPNGLLISQKNIEIPVAPVELRFYEENPLRGLSRSALKNPHLLVGDEMTIRAEPYYFDMGIPTSDQFFEWKVNRQTVENPNTDPLLLTLRRGSGTGRFTVDLHVRNLGHLLQGATDSFVITF